MHIHLIECKFLGKLLFLPQNMIDPKRNGSILSTAEPIKIQAYSQSDFLEKWYNVPVQYNYPVLISQRKLKVNLKFKVMPPKVIINVKNWRKKIKFV